MLGILMPRELHKAIAKLFERKIRIYIMNRIKITKNTSFLSLFVAFLILASLLFPLRVWSEDLPKGGQCQDVISPSGSSETPDSSSVSEPTQNPPVHRGLVGVKADETRVSNVSSETSSFMIRGFDLVDLVKNATLFEVVHLLLKGDFLNEVDVEVRELQALEKNHRFIGRQLFASILFFSHDNDANEVDSQNQLNITENGSWLLGRAIGLNYSNSLDVPSTYVNPTDVLRTTVSQLGARDAMAMDNEPHLLVERTIKLFAKIPLIIAYNFRRSEGKPLLPANKDLSYEENFLYMMLGEVPDAERVDAFRDVLKIYMDHGFNASTFTARVIGSTGSDLYSAITGAIGALKGPLHGGALAEINTMLDEVRELIDGVGSLNDGQDLGGVNEMLSEVKTSGNVENWVHEKLQNKEKIMGFGHRVYKQGDPRVPLLMEWLERMANTEKRQKTLWIMKELMRVMENVREDRRLYPNVDFAAAVLLSWIGFPEDVFVSIFAMTRVIGWVAHYEEQVRSGTLIRPGSAYKGATGLSVSEERLRLQQREQGE